MLRATDKNPGLKKTYNTNFLWVLCTLIGLAVSSQSYGQARSLYKHTYIAKISGLTLSAEQEMKELSEGEYELRTTFDHFLGSIVEISRFQDFTPDADKSTEPTELSLRSISYFYKRLVFGKSKEDHINIDWATQTAHYRNHKGQKRTFPVPESINDKASQIEAVRRALKQGKKSFEISTIERSGIKTALFKVLKEETLKVGAGHFKTIKVEKIRDKNSTKPQRQTRFWMTLHKGEYVLVKMEQVETDGKRYQMEIKELN